MTHDELRKVLEAHKKLAELQTFCDNNNMMLAQRNGELVIWHKELQVMQSTLIFLIEV